MQVQSPNAGYIIATKIEGHILRHSCTKVYQIGSECE